ncbi:unnamed protein product [Leptidea sinapis]|uniref:Nucleoside phosphorylase domain-containing protein n=1 Tax=Leptidea sinapis TaxID=189913 RepID=A0A5E4PPD0_9NEOP|nr:unnamed protein product [Leptidea sinapis]
MDCTCDFILPTLKNWEEHYDNCKIRWLSRGETKFIKNNDGTIILRNEHVLKMKVDVLYHLGFDTQTHDLPSMFGDVKFVCMGGTKQRMMEMAKYMSNLLGVECDLVNLVKHAHRYAMYKVGPVLCVSHGIGIPSMTIALEEVIKMLYYAKAKDPIFIRIGTSGGIGLPAGSVVVSSWGCSGTLEKTYEIAILGKVKKYSAYFDKRLSQELFSISSDCVDFETFSGGTLAANDFYRGEGRTDGAFCSYTETDKLDFLRKLKSMGVLNMEMEATAFAAVTRDAGLRGADVCVTLLDRLQGDQVTPSKETLTVWQRRPLVLVGTYICKYYNI